MSMQPPPPPPEPDQSAARNWALCVSTYNRAAMLRDCVRHALASDLPPAEIVIVDASTSWQDNRAMIEAAIAEAGGCPLRYEPARRKSLTVQRNQAIALAGADILFLIDDDAMLHPACARRIVEYYRADADAHVVAISACNTPAEFVPADVQALKQTNRAGDLVKGRPAPVQRAIDFALRHLLMIPADQRFVTYDRPDQRWQGDARLSEGLARVDFIVGFALTLRRSIALREPFDEGLVGSAIAEDLDASYRFGRHGMLAFAPDAPIHHLEAAAGRDKRRVNTALALLNIGYFVRRNSTRQGRDLARYALWYLRMLLAEIPKDLAGRRWSMPQVRGALLAGRKIPALLRQSRDGLQDWYENFQMQLMTETTSGHGPNHATARDQGVNG
ncbi:glycosyltransferase family 2 protein [Paracoccus sp. PAR01]|uniref:glycosyltransferase family 2 protein n=1 Tax=Paracoccus sp. PAR01 TaxID=2769282 RepID=UPI00177EE09E|nr:glycosyltransferase family 2 protein [Paracoccus sp. PAR01]MBD9525946.1 glycosyltransferase [Paracoccus sp. PAR01]